jgi:hypothetical protein
MKAILGTVSFLLALAWIFVFFILHQKGLAVHMLLVVAILLTIIRIAQMPVEL